MPADLEAARNLSGSMTTPGRGGSAQVIEDADNVGNRALNPTPPSTGTPTPPSMSTATRPLSPSTCLSGPYAAALLSRFAKSLTNKYMKAFRVEKEAVQVKVRENEPGDGGSTATGSEPMPASMKLKDAASSMTQESALRIVRNLQSAENSKPTASSSAYYLLDYPSYQARTGSEVGKASTNLNEFLFPLPCAHFTAH